MTPVFLLMLTAKSNQTLISSFVLRISIKSLVYSGVNLENMIRLLRILLNKSSGLNAVLCLNPVMIKVYL